MDLSGMLKNSDGDIQYNRGGGWKAVQYYHETSNPKIIQWVIKYSGGLIKNENQAGYVLFGFVAAAIIVSLFLFFGGGGSGYLSEKEQKEHELLMKKDMESQPSNF